MVTLEMLLRLIDGLDTVEIWNGQSNIHGSVDSVMSMLKAATLCAQVTGLEVSGDRIKIWIDSK